MCLVFHIKKKKKNRGRNFFMIILLSAYETDANSKKSKTAFLVFFLFSPLSFHFLPFFSFFIFFFFDAFFSNKMLSVNHMLNTEQQHYDSTTIYSSPSCQSPQRLSMLDIANLLCRDEDEDDNSSQLTTPCLSVNSSPMISHTRLNPPSFINLSNLDHYHHQGHSECDDHLSITTMSPLTPPLRSSPYYHKSLSSDSLYSSSNKTATDYQYQHRLMFASNSNSSEDHPPSPYDTNDEEDHRHHHSSIKTKRKRATNKQLQVLQSVFEHTFFPSTHVRSQLGRQLGMNPRTVQIWFQNRRQALRTKEKRNGIL
ncbi:unnamed protein product [Absidia cylindrospora]